MTSGILLCALCVLLSTAIQAQEGTTITPSNHHSLLGEQKETQETQTTRQSNHTLKLAKIDHKKRCMPSYCKRIAAGMCLAIMFYGGASTQLYFKGNNNNPERDKPPFKNPQELTAYLRQQLESTTQRLYTTLNSTALCTKDSTKECEVITLLHNTIASLVNQQGSTANAAHEALLMKLGSCYTKLLPETPRHHAHNTEEYVQEVTNILLHIASELETSQNNPKDLAASIQQLLG